VAGTLGFADRTLVGPWASGHVPSEKTM
jgi:hypothetical protein